MTIRHFLTLHDLSKQEHYDLLQRAIELKEMHRRGEIYEPLKNRVMGMIFEKSSTRTRVSFESAMIQFGGSAIFLSPRDTQLGRGEPIDDTAKVLSSMVDVLMVRTYEHEKIIQFADNSSVPVINALTDHCHPCQLLADMQTYYEHRGDITGKTVCWIGDGNNMCNSYINAAQIFGFQLHIACPEGFEPDHDYLKKNQHRVKLFDSAQEAAVGCDLVVTDVWASMGQEQEADERFKLFLPYQVNQDVMNQAQDDALFMHCLPAHRGEEVSTDVIDGPQSVIFDEAENRLHSQKALLEKLLNAQ